MLVLMLLAEEVDFHVVLYRFELHSLRPCLFLFSLYTIFQPYSNIGRLSLGRLGGASRGILAQGGRDYRRLMDQKDSLQ